MTLYGVDVSQYQGTPDWARAKAAGIEFGIARCVREGTLGIDATYAPNVKAMKAAGVIPGAYDYISPGMGASHAKTFVAVVGDPAGMLIALDIEAVGIVTADVDAWMAVWRAAHPTHPVLQYGSQYNVLATSSKAANGPLWLAAYPVPTADYLSRIYASIGGDGAAKWGAKFSGWTGPAIWQFTSSGVVEGISGRVDGNAFRGTRAELLALTGTKPEADLNPKYDMPVAVADVSAGTPVIDATTGATLLASWNGGSDIGLYSRGGGNAAIRIDLGAGGSDLHVAYVRDTHISNVRLPGAQPPTGTAGQAELDAATKAGFEKAKAAALTAVGGIAP